MVLVVTLGRLGDGERGSEFCGKWSQCNAKTVSIKQLAPLKQIQHVLWLIN